MAVQQWGVTLKATGYGNHELQNLALTVENLQLSLPFQSSQSKSFKPQPYKIGLAAIIMSAEDAIEALCEQLTSFHISARLQRLAVENIPIKATKINCNKPSDYSQNPPPATQPSITLKIAGLPPPNGKRPCWEPPVLDH